MPICRHCERTRRNLYRKGLCRQCHKRHANQYQSPYQHGQRSPIATGRLLPEPTAARPGTPEKIQVMIERAERGELLFHPLDGRIG